MTATLLAGLVGFLWDKLAFIPWYILTNQGKKVEYQMRKKSQLMPGENNIWISGDTDRVQETYYYGHRTMDKVFLKAVEQFADLPALGTRELLQEVDEVQPNGKVFKKAVYGEYKWITFREFGQKVEFFAKALTEIDAKRVAIYMETRACWQIACQAAFQHNIDIVTVYASLGDEAVAAALQEAEVDYLLTSGDLVNKSLVGVLKKVPTLKAVVWAPFDSFSAKLKVKQDDYPNTKIIEWEDMYEIGRNSKKAKPEGPTPETISMIMYTSGTSGKPKGVMIQQKGMVAACSGIGERIQTGHRFSPDDTYIGYLPLAHILECMAESCVLWNGTKIGYSSALTLTDLSSRIKKGSQGDATVLKPTLLAAVPEILERIRKGVQSKVSNGSPFGKWLFNFAYDYKVRQLELGRDTPILNKLIFSKTAAMMGGNLRLLLSGGAPLEEKTQRFSHVTLCAPILIGYGLTESSGGVAVSDVFDNQVKRCGGVIDTMMVKLEPWEEAGYFPTNDPPQGEVLFGGPALTVGYFKMPEKTAEDYVTDEQGRVWFKSGDIGQIDTDGALKIVDRKKDLVKLRHGEYLALGKIEAALKTSKYLANICVFADSNELSCVAVAVAKEDEVLRTATEMFVSGDFETVCKDERIVKLISDDLRKVAVEVKLTKQEIPSKIYVESLQWLPETGLVTDAFKLKRKPLNEYYAQKIAQLYKK